ncbi:MAG: MarR family transcriptional regulator [Bdellovibrionales bacterium]|nr:MarR family transcriptional regulator [Bdellovibrionales bacterium]
MKNYLNRILGRVLSGEVVVKQIDPGQLQLKLPALITRHYDFSLAAAPQLSKTLLLAEPRRELPPRVLEQHFRLMATQHPSPVLYYFENLSAHKRRQLRKANVQFLVGDRFLFAPQLGFIGDDPALKMRFEDVLESKRLRPLSESIVIGQLLDERFEGLSGKEISEQLHVSPAAVSQSLAELERNEFVFLERSGRVKLAHFPDRSQLWHEAQRKLSNPVEAEILIESLPDNAVKAGLSALSELTMLVDNDAPTFALAKTEFNYFIENNDASKLSSKANYRLQSWRREPKLFADLGRVDPISLYLTLRTSEDERVLKELGMLLSVIGLELSNA